MRVLITGAAGFVGRHLLTALHKAGDKPLATDLHAESSAGIMALDICDACAVDNCIRSLKPDACIHLAGVSFVPDAARNPTALRAINFDGPIHVAQALLQHAPQARMVFISTSQVYGPKRCLEPLTENDAIYPQSPYAQSKAKVEKALQEMAATQDLNLVIARPGNHTGPGQSPKFVVPAFAHAIRQIRDGLKSKITVGNLESERDFTDVRDVVDAYWLLLHKAEKGRIYNISAGRHLKIGALLQLIATLAAVSAPVEVDPEIYRPTDATPPLDTTRLRQLGWEPRYSLERTLEDLWRETATA